MIAVEIETLGKDEFPQMKYITMQIGLLEAFLGYLDNYTCELKKEKKELLNKHK